MRHLKLLCILLVAVLAAAFCIDASAQFKEEAFSQQYNDDPSSAADSTDVLFSFKEYFGGLRHQNEIRIGTMTIFPFDVQHDAAEPLGFVITSSVTGERVLFFTDTYYVKYVFPCVDIIMGECNYSLDTMQSRRDRLFESHMSLDNFLELLENYPNVRKIYLLHLSDDNSDAELFRREVRKKTGAEVYVCSAQGGYD